MKEQEKQKPVYLRALALAAALLMIILPIFAALVLSKAVKLNHPAGLKGADISSYQGEVDWAVLAPQLDFIFIKATEGSTWVDDNFAQNWAGAASSGLPAGAYHFFSFDSDGRSQAENFINTIDSAKTNTQMLPPVIDVEFYGSYSGDPKGPEYVKTELGDMIAALEEHYGTKPIIYCTGKAFELYRNCFEGCPLWIRNVYFYPVGKEWLFWQYSDTEVLKGYKGDEKYIDMNAFAGTKEALLALTVKERSNQ